MEKARKFAEKLLQIKAVRISADEPFIWASGWRSPVYCDNRKVLSDPQLRSYVKDQLAESIRKSFPGASAIAGVATAGIPHGVLAADALRLPFFYVRSKPKTHGLGNQIEGGLVKGQKVVVIEDLVSTGKSSLEAVDALRAAEADVIGMCTLFTYGFPQAEALFANAGISLISISNYSVLIEIAEELGLIKTEDKEQLSEWRLHPATWGR